MFVEAPAEQIREIYISEDFDDPACMERLKELPYEVVTKEVFRKMSDTESPQGILCVLNMPSYEIEEILQREAPLLMLLEDIQDPGNLGTILRTGAGAGVDGIVMSRGGVDIFNPKTSRSTMGSIYRVPFVIAEDFGGAIELLQSHGVQVYAAHLAGSVQYDLPDYRKASAFLIGNEGNGLREETAAKASGRIRIPMAGKVESLNAAMASGILMYEAASQRNK